MENTFPNEQKFSETEFGDEDLVELDRKLPDFIDGAQDGNAVDRLAPLPGVVVEKSDRATLDTGVVEDLPQHLLRGIPCAHDEQPRALFLVGVEKGKESGVEEARRDGPSEVDPDEQADPTDEHQGNQGIQYDDTYRKTLKVTDEQKGEGKDPRTDHRRLDDVDEIGDARVAPHAPVESKPEEDENLQGDDPRQSLSEHAYFF